METKIKEIQDYFIAKILKADFRITKMTEHVVCILIDEKYKFKIWAANGPEHRKPYEDSEGYFMSLPFTTKQAIKCNSILRSRIEKWRKEVMFTEKRKQLEQLKKELGEE